MKALNLITGSVSTFLMVLVSCSGDNGISPVNVIPFGTLSVDRTTWSQASQPAGAVHTFKNRMNNFVWFNPIQQVRIADIYPARRPSPDQPARTNVLTVRFLPDTTQTAPDIWDGIMQNVPDDSVDQASASVIEIMVKGDQGRLHIDLGVLSEDVIPNGRLDSEDKSLNGVLDPGEDTGLDGMGKPDPPKFNYARSNFVGQSVAETPYDFWDVNQNGLKDAGEPWSYDNWFYPELSISYVTEGSGSIDGTENNADDAAGRLPNTEDINFNGVLDTENDYFSYSFSLEKTHADTTLIVGGNPGKGWFLYQIPFDATHADRVVGSPSKSEIRCVRLWFDELPSVVEDNEVSVALIHLK